MPEISIGPQPGPQTAFMESPADLVIYGGAAGGGKSYGLLLEGLRHYEMPGFSFVILRRTMPEIIKPGSLWDESMKMYPLVNGVPLITKHRWTFASGAYGIFSHLEYDKTVADWHGAQIPYIGFDELTTFTERQFFYMLSRNRTVCPIVPYMRATCNPDSESWVRKFIAWWIAEDGYANLSRCGVLRFFSRLDDNIIWGDTPDEVKRKYGRQWPDNIEPKSITFIPACIYDNPALLKANPEYLGNLFALPQSDRERLLGDRKRGGSWDIKAGGTMFKAEWFEFADDFPHEAAVLRRWDVAATEPERGKDPDWSAGVLLAFHAGVWYVVDVIRDRLNPAALEKRLAVTAQMDGVAVPIRMEQEPGASGKIVISNYARGIFAGFDFKGIPSTGSKELRAKPLSAAAENGNVKIVRGAWNKAFMNEIESFGPDSKHDDQVDAAAGAMSDLSGAALNPHVYGDGSQETFGEIALNRKIEELIAAMGPEEKAQAAELRRLID